MFFDAYGSHHRGDYHSDYVCHHSCLWSRSLHSNDVPPSQTHVDA